MEDQMKNKLPTVLFEGLDGAGKTYALTYLKRFYENKNIPIHVVDSIPFNVFLDSHDKAWFDLNLLNVRYTEYMAWQVNNYYKNIRPFIGKELILIDRYLPSCFAYNSMDDDRFSAFLADIMDSFLRKFFIPDITFLVDVPNEVLLERHEKTDQPVEMSKLVFINKVRDNYRKFYSIYHSTGLWRNVFVLDGTKEINSLVKEMVSIIDNFYEKV